jgi:hypothetical protein
MIVAGFDLGGKNNFGWCVLRANPFDVALDRNDVAVGTAEHAIAARDAVVAELGGEVALEAAAIDAPLFWQPAGQEIDREVHALHLNSLRGGCLVQGLLVGRELKATFPRLRLTEVYPRWLADQIESNPTIRKNLQNLHAHERDAFLAVLAAWAMIEGRKGWRNRIPVDNNEVWMPIGEREYWLPSNLA